MEYDDARPNPHSSTALPIGPENILSLVELANALHEEFGLSYLFEQIPAAFDIEPHDYGRIDFPSCPDLLEGSRFLDRTPCNREDLQQVLEEGWVCFQKPTGND